MNDAPELKDISPTSPSSASVETVTTPTTTITPPPSPSAKSSKLESLAEQILQELKRREQPHTDFSVSKLFAGVVQIVALACLFLAYLNRGSANAQTETTLLFAIFLEILTVALLIMARQR